MCIHPTKSGEICQKNPERFLCGTHLLHVQFARVPESVIDLMERKFDSSKAKSVMDPGRVDHWVFYGNRAPQLDAYGNPTGHKPGRFYNGSDFMGELRRIAGTNFYVVYGRDGEIFDARDIVSQPETPQVPGLVLRSTTHRVHCGTCQKRGVEDPYHDDTDQVKACYADRYREEGLIS